MKITKLIKLIAFISFCSISAQQSFTTALINKYDTCRFPKFTCTTNTLCQLYPDQNMCVLLQEIPQELQNLPCAIYPNNITYDLNRFIFNKRFNIFPHAIFKPRDCCELKYVVSILKKYNLEFALRSGGHCFEPGSLSPGYVIDLENFNFIRLDQNKQEVCVGAGVRLGPLLQRLAKFNLAIPTGTCGANGVSGLALGGGVGFLARQFGLTCDVITSITILTADLNIITADNNNYSDLFWALRGAGNGSYGIVIGITFKVFPVDKVSLLELDWPWDGSNIQAIVTAWQTWVSTLPNEVTAELDLDYVNGQKSISITAMKVGIEPFNGWQDIFLPLNPASVKLNTISYVEASRIVGDTSPLPFLKTKSKMIFTPLSNAGIQVMIDYFESLTASNKQFSVHLEFDSAGGQSAIGDTAYFPRNAFAWFFMHMRWNDQTQTDDALASINSFYASIEPFTSPYSYANIVDYDLGNTYLNAYYGTNVPRLIQIKDKYDPTNLFKWQQSIPISL